ncbi:PAS domain S-box protein [Mucilaginibacter rubeus]|uniref:histidine kinase n=1 Tax=Mucilaginibacter rubeus TaxID=2027860 RepID=A0A5C1HVX5_9SPHI|nr:PAS domain S-box protein [Mucilaginibacter rubeus]QEM09974.1 PAS domain S-box protein [Mucilaginibacter rubeus]
MNLKDDEHLKFFIESAPIGIAVLDASVLEFEIVNEKFLEITGNVKSEILGKSFWTPFPETRKSYEEELIRISKTGRPYQAEDLELKITKNGREDSVFLNFVFVPVSNVSDKITKIAVWVIEHKTRQPKVQTIIETNEKRLKALVNATSDVVYSLSADWEIMQPLDGRGFLQDTSRPIKGWRTQNIHPDHMELVNKTIAGAIHEKKIFQLEHKVIRADGSAGWTFSRAVPILNVDGEIIEWFGTASDITERKHMELELQRSRESSDRQKRIYETITSSSPDLMYVFGLDYRFTYANKALLTMWGKSYEDAVGKSLLENGYEPWHAEMHEREIDLVVATGKPIRGEVSFPHAILGKRIYDYIFTPVFNEVGEVTSIAGTTRDVTERKLEEQQLQLLINMLPASVVVIRGNELIVEMINQSNLDYWHKTAAEVVGKPFLEILPDLAGQPFAGQLRHVMATGDIIDVKESPVLFENPDGSIRETFVDYTYQPLTDLNGKRTGVLVMSSEITDRVIARRQIEQSEKNLKAMIAQAPVAMCILMGTDHVITVANDMMIELWGKPLADVMNRPVFEALPDARGQGLEEVMKKVYETGEPFYASELPVSLIRHGRQEVVYQNFVYQAYRDAAGEIVGVFAITIDVTSQVEARVELQQINEEMAAANEELATTNEELTEIQKRYEATNRELEASSSRLRMAIESTSLGTWEYYPQSGGLYWSKECRDVYGIPDNLVPDYQAFADHIHADDRQWVEVAINEVLNPAGNGHYDISYRIIRFDNGETRWIKAQGTVYFEVEKPILFIGTVVDISDMKEADEKSAKLAAIIENSHDAIVSKTLEGIITSWNASAQRVFGYTAEEMIGDSIYKVIPPDRHSEEPHILATIASGKSINHFETKRLTKEGILIDVSVTVSPIRDKAGRIIGVSKIARDITEKKQAETRKSDFIGMVSHELKTPLTSLGAIIQVANLKLKNSEDKFLSGAMQKGALQIKRMTNMINGFLNISRLESGKIHIDKQEFDLCELILEAIEETQLIFGSHEIHFDGCPLIRLNADRDKIASVISNFISNAIKYSPKAKDVYVMCKTQDEEVVVSVKDEGMGIEPGDLERIFDRYYRVESNHTRHISGFGIGLYLSSEIIERHGGKVWAESQSGIGSVFHFSLPLDTRHT